MLNSKSELTRFFDTLNQTLPQKARGETLCADMMPTPLGEMLAVCSPQGLCLLEFVGQVRLDKELRDLVQFKSLPIQWHEHEILTQTRAQLNAYFSGSLKQFSLPLDFIGTPFQQQVWRVLCRIPYGQTWSYLAQAKELGNPKAVRAVAAANGQNKISIIVPCHRVIGSNGKLTGYAGGLPRKQALLSLEAGDAVLSLFEAA